MSKTSAVLEDSINLTLEISNPTSNTLHLTYTLYANVYAVFSQGSAVRGDTGAYYGTSVVDTLVLQPGAKMTLPPTPVHFATPGIAEDYATGETFSLEPGNWSLKACVFGPGATSQIWVPVCGNNISFTVLQ